MHKSIAGAAIALTGLALSVSPASAGEPNCVEFFETYFQADIANHGQHILGDYVTGIGHDGDWPPAGQVGEVVGADHGALMPGRSGILQHGASPGASFCNGSSSPTHPPGLD